MAKPKVCKTCREKFTPHNTLQKVCSMICAIEYAANAREKHRLAQAKSARKLVKEARDKLKTLSDYLGEAQDACNSYIRARDRKAGQSCISCGTRKTDIQYCAGHYRSRGAAPELRFNKLNIHLQCNNHCNRELSGNKEGYRPRLLEKIGLKQLEWLEGPHAPQRYTIQDAKDIKAYFRDQKRRLEDESVVDRSCDYFGAGGQS